MTYLVMGTREKHYRVETLHDLTAWVDDEIGEIGAGWLPIASETQPDGSMRVVYGRLPQELDALADQDPEVHTVPAGGGFRADAGRAATGLALLGMIAVAALATLSLVARGI
jgi:hypothetical protein